MSETKTYIGKAIPTNKTVEQFLLEHDKISADELALHLEHKDSFLLEIFYDNFYEQAIVHNNYVFWVTSKDHTEEDIFFAQQNTDNSFSFVVQYYNGSCGFGEAISNALASVDKFSSKDRK